MTLITQSTKAVAQGNGATTTWPFTFLIPAIEDLTLTLVDIASGNPTVISPVNFTVTGLGDPDGGAVTYPLTGSPVPVTSYVVVERFVPDVQETDFTLQGAVYPTDIEDALDYLTMITQQQQDQINRSIVFSVADTVTSTLPPASARAGLYLAFDSSGNPIAAAGLNPSVTVSAAMIPVVTAPTTAAALTALGIPGSLLNTLIPAGTIWDYAAAGTAPTGFVYPIGQACTSLYPVYRALLISASSPFGTNGTDPLMPDLRSAVIAGKSNMGGVDNGLLPGGTVLGAILGAYQTLKTLITANLPAYTPAGTITNGAITFPNSGIASATTGSTNNISVGVNAATRDLTSALLPVQATSTLAGTAQGGTSTPIPVSTIQPTIICNKIIKVH